MHITGEKDGKPVKVGDDGFTLVQLFKTFF